MHDGGFYDTSCGCRDIPDPASGDRRAGARGLYGHGVIGMHGVGVITGGLVLAHRKCDRAEVDGGAQLRGRRRAIPVKLDESPRRACDSPNEVRPRRVGRGKGVQLEIGTEAFRGLDALPVLRERVRAVEAGVQVLLRLHEGRDAQGKRSEEHQDDQARHEASPMLRATVHDHVPPRPSGTKTIRHLLKGMRAGFDHHSV